MENRIEEQNSDSEKEAPSWAAWVFLVTGLIIMLMGIGVLPFERQAGEAPEWVLTISGGVFFTAGLMIRIGRRSAWNDLLAAVMLMFFAVIGGWVALQGGSEGFSGGLPILGRSVNLLLGRVLFGMGSVICFILSLYALRILMRKLNNSARKADHNHLNKGGME